MSQPQGNITCRALSCCKLVYRAIPSVKIGNGDTLIPVHFHGDKYCSASCQNRDQRIQPVLHRIEDMIHVLFLQFSDATNTFRVISERVYQEQYANRRQIVALDKADRPGTVSLLEENSLSFRGQLAFLSFNKCTTVLTVFAPLMAYLCEDLGPSIQIHEAHVDNVLSDQEVHVLYLGKNGEHKNVPVAKWHSMFRITATKEDSTTVLAEPARLNGTGIYCDTTAAQYGRVAGLEDAKAYHSRHPNSKTIYYTSLGFYRRICHLTNVDPNRAEDGTKHINALSQEAYIQTMNNVVHGEIDAMGGWAHLLAMTSANFEAACTSIAARVRLALLDVAVKIHELWLNLPQGMVFASVEDTDRYQAVVNRCKGAGHAACLQALRERAPDTWAYEHGRVRYSCWE